MTAKPYTTEEVEVRRHGAPGCNENRWLATLDAANADRDRLQAEVAALKGVLGEAREAMTGLHDDPAWKLLARIDALLGDK